MFGVRRGAQGQELQLLQGGAVDEGVAGRHQDSGTFWVVLVFTCGEGHTKYTIVVGMLVVKSAVTPAVLLLVVVMMVLLLQLLLLLSTVTMLLHPT